jgi:hypothetical protein
MTITGTTKGHEVTTKKGYTNSEAKIALIASGSLSINNNLGVFYQGRAVDTIKEGLQSISGANSKAFVDTDWLQQVNGITSQINFSGITNPSSTHIVSEKTATDGNTKLAPGSWSGTEISTANYSNIGADDASEFSRTSSTASQYPAILVKFDNAGTATEANIDFFKLEIIGYGTGDTNGFEVFAYDYDGSDWEKIGESDASTGYGSIITSLPSPQKYIEAVTGDIYFMVRPLSAKGTADSVLHIDFINLKVRNSSLKPLQVSGENLVFLLSDGTNSITLTATDIKINNWNFAYADTGETVFENVDWIASGLTKV